MMPEEISITRNPAALSTSQSSTPPEIPAPGVGLWEAHKDTGNKYFRNNNFEQAIKCYTEAIKLANDVDPALYSNRAAAYLKNKQYTNACQDAQKALSIDPFFTKAFNRLYQAQLYMGRFNQCVLSTEAQIEILTDVISKGYKPSLPPISPSTLPTNGKNKDDASSGTFPENKNGVVELDFAAITNFKTVLYELKNNLRTAKTSLNTLEKATSLLQENKYTEALTIIRPLMISYSNVLIVAATYAEAVAPTDPDSAHRVLTTFNSSTYDNDTSYLYARAFVSYHRGIDGLKIAQSILRQILSFDPDHVASQVLRKRIQLLNSYKEKGNKCFKDGSYEEAVSHYTTAIEADAHNKKMSSVLRGNRSAAYVELKQWTKAMGDVEFAIENGNTSAKLYARRSKINEELEKYEEAARDMNKAAELDSQYRNKATEIQGRSKRARRKDFYKILDIPKTAAVHEIKKAYKKQALVWHPDKWAHDTPENQVIAENKFKELGEAWAVLGDARKKQLYDSGAIGSGTEGEMAADGMTMGGGAVFGDMFGMMFGMGSGSGGERTGTRMRQTRTGNQGSTQTFFFSFK